VGGRLVIESQPYLGTKVVVTVPDAPPNASDRSPDGDPTAKKG
jgi:hypothetical protein